MEVDMKRNLTLSLDEQLLRLARMVCQKRDTTLTQFIRDQLEIMVSRDEEYQSSMKRKSRAESLELREWVMGIIPPRFDRYGLGIVNC